jgi:hypothetical protein
MRLTSHLFPFLGYNIEVENNLVWRTIVRQNICVMTNYSFYDILYVIKL